MWEDPIVSEVRREREQLAARFGFDVKAIFDDLRNRQAMLGNRLVSRKRQTKTGEVTSLATRGTEEAASVCVPQEGTGSSPTSLSEFFQYWRDRLGPDGISFFVGVQGIRHD